MHAIGKVDFGPAMFRIAIVERITGAAHRVVGVRHHVCENASSEGYGLLSRGLAVRQRDRVAGKRRQLRLTTRQPWLR